MRLFTSIFALSLLLVVMSGCDSRDTAQMPEPVRITVITVGPGGDDVEIGARGAMTMLNDRSDANRPGVNLTMVKVASAGDAAEALNQINADKTAQGVAVNCLDSSNEMQEAINNLAATGIPVVTYFDDCPDSQRAAFIGRRSDGIGRSLGGAMVSLISAQQAQGQRQATTHVAAIITTEPQLQLIEAAARTYIDSFAEIVMAPTVRTAAGAEGIRDAIRSVRTQNPNVTHWLIIAPTAVPAADAAPLADLPQSRRGTVVYGGMQGSVDAVTSNVVDVVVARNGAEYGAATVQILHGMIANQQSFGPIVELGPDTVNQQNLTEVRNRLKGIEQGTSIPPVYPTGRTFRITSPQNSAQEQNQTDDSDR